LFKFNSIRAPKISLENSRGLSAQQVNQLSEDLASLAESLVGEVMIYEITQHIRVFFLFFFFLLFNKLINVIRNFCWLLISEVINHFMKKCKHDKLNKKNKKS